MRSRFHSLLSRLLSLHDRVQLRSQAFVLISNNCWGFESYKALGREYNTPFVGLFLHPGDYLKLLARFDELSGQRPVFTRVSRHRAQPVDYPIGVLWGDVELHFLHYATAEEAALAWARRVARLQQAVARGVPLLFKMCDRDGCSAEQLRAFHECPLVQRNRKVSFGACALAEAGHLQVPPRYCEAGGRVIDGLALYRRRYALFDFATWVKTGRVQRAAVLGRVASIL